MQNGTLFPRLIEEYGNKERESSEDSKKLSSSSSDQDDSRRKHQDTEEQAKVAAALMQAEERNTGAVAWEIYRRYLGYAGSPLWALVIAGLLVLNQGSQRLSSGRSVSDCPWC
jgi:ATP-binding cassette, subfamily C (CFTR/MRP), member 1